MYLTKKKKWVHRFPHNNRWRTLYGRWKQKFNRLGEGHTELGQLYRDMYGGYIIPWDEYFKMHPDRAQLPRLLNDVWIFNMRPDHPYNKAKGDYVYG